MSGSGANRVSNLAAAGAAGAGHAPAGAFGKLRNLQFGGPMRLERAAEREAFLLMCICFIDTMTTLWWVVTGRATEANPFLQWTFQYHPIVFVVVKLLSFLPACYFIVRLAQRYPAFTVGLTRLVAIAYLLLYVTGLFGA